MPAESDISLLRRVAAKDRKAFEALYHLYYQRIFGYVWKLARRAELVEEVVNDVMLVIWEKAASFDARAQVSTWIFGIAYHKALKALARQSRNERDPETEHREQRQPMAGEAPDNLMVRRELASTLGKALLALSPEHRAVVELTYFYELSYQEIAEIVGCPVNTVKTRMFHARRRLRELLPEMGISSHAG
ncbi:MAG: sigma-70 family RNA polymerase sigma factor [Acidobacteriota bacterium]|nr:sigma-70 family RNA polymerase sigma factor [Acidobacteriota bacterium]